MEIKLGNVNPGLLLELFTSLSSSPCNLCLPYNYAIPLFPSPAGEFYFLPFIK